MSTKTITVKAGETIVLPKGAKVVSVAVDGDINLSTSCSKLEDVLSNPEQYRCYEFSYGCDDDHNSAQHMLDLDDAWLTRMRIGDQEFNLQIRIPDTEAPWFESQFKSVVPDSLMKYQGKWINSLNNRREIKLYVKMVPSLAKVTKLYAIGSGFYNNFVVEPYLMETCPE